MKLNVINQMMAKRILYLLMGLWLVAAGCTVKKTSPGQALPGNGINAVPNPKNIVLLWASSDPEVASKTVFPYAMNARANGWFENVTIIIWGPSVRTLTRDSSLQHEIRTMKKIGIVLEACKSCSDSYQVSGQLEALGVDVKYMGKQLTDYIQAGSCILTF